MSMWQFFAMIAEGGDGLSEAEADDLWDWLKAKNGD